MGVNDDWSFDKDASDVYGCEVHGFDPSPAGLASMAASVFFFSSSLSFSFFGLG
jgi:hypothetical protein